MSNFFKRGRNLLSVQGYFRKIEYMLIPSHALLAKRVADHVEKNCDMKLCAAAFYRGSIAPDLFDKDKGSHYAPACPSYIQKILRSFDDTDSDKMFSYKLGLLLHFVSDYFTAAHNDETLMHNMKQHMVYETQLHFLLMKDSTERLIAPCRSGDSPEMLANSHARYLEADYDCRRDLDFILTTCTRLAAGLVAERLEATVALRQVAIA